MRTAFWLLLVALVPDELARAQGNNTRLLTGFEDEPDLHQWECHDAFVARSEQNATQGRYTLQLTLSPRPVSRDAVAAQ
jgi:hypothetical protein